MYGQKRPPSLGPEGVDRSKGLSFSDPVMLFDLPVELRVMIVGRLTDWHDISSFSRASKACYELAGDAVVRVDRWCRSDRESPALEKKQTLSVKWLKRFRRLEGCLVPVACSGIVDTYKASSLALRQTAIELSLNPDLYAAIEGFDGEDTHASAIVLFTQIHDLHMAIYREKSGRNGSDAAETKLDFDLTIVSKKLPIAKLRTTPSSIKLLVRRNDNVRYEYSDLELFASRFEGNGGVVKLGVTDVLVEDAKEELVGKVESLTVYSGDDNDEIYDVVWDFKPFVSLRRIVFKGRCRSINALHRSLPKDAKVYFRCVLPFKWIWELASLPCVKEVWCKTKFQERIQERGLCDPATAEKIRYGIHPSYEKNLRRGTY